MSRRDDTEQTILERRCSTGLYLYPGGDRLASPLRCRRLSFLKKNPLLMQTRYAKRASPTAVIIRLEGRGTALLDVR
jgi:hypothetical protein